MEKKIKLAKAKMLELYKTMVKIRVFEQTAVKLFTSGLLPGFLHPSIGQEAVAAGVCACLHKNDYITSTHRGHGHAIAKGVDIKKIMAELFGKREGLCKGKGGSMHIADFSLGIIGANGIVGGGIPIATGVGLSILLRKTKQVVVCFFGDGASNQGTFHEGLNLASIWKLPVIFLCENNLYALSTSQSKSENIKEISIRAISYGIPGVTVDGNDVLAVCKETLRACKRAHEGNGPTLLECRTYRRLGHYVGDPASYRPKEEEKAWKEKDPIETFERHLLAEQILNEEKIKAIWQKFEEEVEEAVEYAKQCDNPSPEEALEDVYTKNEVENWQEK